LNLFFPELYFWFVTVSFLIFLSPTCDPLQIDQVLTEYLFRYALFLLNCPYKPAGLATGKLVFLVAGHGLQACPIPKIQMKTAIYTEFWLKKQHAV